MSQYIYIEDLVANALIQKIEKNQSREVRFSELNEYGVKLVAWWSDKRKIQVTVLLSKFDTDRMMSNYADFFSTRLDPDIGEFIFSLKPDKTSEDLRKTFRSYLSVDLLLSFIEAYSGL